VISLLGPAFRPDSPACAGRRPPGLFCLSSPPLRCYSSYTRVERRRSTDRPSAPQPAAPFSNAAIRNVAAVAARPLALISSQLVSSPGVLLLRMKSARLSRRTGRVGRGPLFPAEGTPESARNKASRGGEAGQRAGSRRGDWRAGVGRLSRAAATGSGRHGRHLRQGRQRGCQLLLIDSVSLV
jgi:hypothetical protein